MNNGPKADSPQQDERTNFWLAPARKVARNDSEHLPTLCEIRCRAHHSWISPFQHNVVLAQDAAVTPRLAI